MTHPLEVLGIGDQALVHAAAVAFAAGLDLLDVRVRLLLLPEEVVDQDLRVARPVDQSGAGGLQPGDLLVLGQRGQLVPELVET
ncbi:MAG: hypothetical protein ABWX84_00645 [Nocardioides sp.]